MNWKLLGIAMAALLAGGIGAAWLAGSGQPAGASDPNKVESGAPPSSPTSSVTGDLSPLRPAFGTIDQVIAALPRDDRDRLDNWIDPSNRELNARSIAAGDAGFSGDPRELEPFFAFLERPPVLQTSTDPKMSERLEFERVLGKHSAMNMLSHAWASGGPYGEPTRTRMLDAIEKYADYPDVERISVRRQAYTLLRLMREFHLPPSTSPPPPTAREQRLLQKLEAHGAAIGFDPTFRFFREKYPPKP